MTRTPDVLTLRLTLPAIIRLRQAHRATFCDHRVRELGFPPHPAEADQWWPGTTMSRAELTMRTRPEDTPDKPDTPAPTVDEGP